MHLCSHKEKEKESEKWEATIAHRIGDDIAIIVVNMSKTDQLKRNLIQWTPFHGLKKSAQLLRTFLILTWMLRTWTQVHANNFLELNFTHHVEAYLLIYIHIK